MTDRCDDLHAYVDGELGGQDLAEFESHLATCATCAAELPRLLALLVALDGAAAAAARAPSRVPHLALVTGEPGPEPADRDERRPERPRAAPPSGSRRRRWWLVGGLVAAAAAVVVVAVPRPQAPATVASSESSSAASLDAALGPARPFDARLSYPGAGGHRPVDVQRGAEPAAAASDRQIQLELELERARNWHGAAVVALLAGDRDHAARAFARAPATPAVESDRAALELLDGRPAALERALEHVDRALAAEPNQPAALWNRALVLAALDLPLAAANELDRVRALGEPGWADEARQRAEVLRRAVAARRERWSQAAGAKRSLIERAAPVPPQVAQVTGYMTLVLYDAARAAPSRAAALALLPLARTLDTAYRSDHLASYVQRVAAGDFRIRKPLADTYRELLFGPPLADAAVDAYLRRLEQAGADDILLGALVRTRRVAARLAAYRKLAAASGDPWFTAIAEQETAAAELARGGVAAAERRLHQAIAFAQRERLGYRVLVLRDQLVQLYKRVHQLTRAAEEARQEYREAIAGGEGVLEMNALADLVALEQDRYANGLARAYLSEELERAQTTAAAGPSPFDEDHDCETRQYAHQSLAHLSLDNLDADRARDWLTGSPTCGRDFAVELTLQRALAAAELHRLARQDGDAALARASLAALPAAALSPGQHAIVDLIEGMLVLDSDRGAGQRHLRDAIARAGHVTGAADVGVKARAYSFSLLALGAGAANDFAQAIALLAEALGVPTPERCALAIAHYAERSVVAFAGARGETGGRYVVDRTPRELDAAALVPADVVDRLRACDRVVVLARAPVLGTARLLPPDVAWSYLLRGKTSPGAPPAAARRLVVANPDTPPDLGLPPLGPYPADADDGATVLRGADATPTRVLLAMRDASVIEFHTHGIIGNDVSEASYLALSPELNRQYALTAGDVAEVRLDAHPLVVLGACHAAASSRSLEGGMGLAEAFLRSGARAVIASPEAVQDRTAPAFFAAVRDRVMRGADPAIALRDERMRRPTSSRDDSWVSGVVVFE